MERPKSIYLFNPSTGCKIIAYYDDDDWEKVGLVKIEKDNTYKILLGSDSEQKGEYLSLIGVGGTYAPGFEKVSYECLAAISPFIKERIDELAKILHVVID